MLIKQPGPAQRQVRKSNPDQKPKPERPSRTTLHHLAAPSSQPVASSGCACNFRCFRPSVRRRLFAEVSFFSQEGFSFRFMMWFTPAANRPATYRTAQPSSLLLSSLAPLSSRPQLICLPLEDLCAFVLNLRSKRVYVLNLFIIILILRSWLRSSLWFWLPRRSAGCLRLAT